MHYEYNCSVSCVDKYRNRKCYKVRYFYTRGESKLREYLNGDFLKENMSKEQIDMILLSQVCTLDEHRESEITYDFYTEDKVFLLSKDELKLYMPEESDRNYANKSWWLRTHNSENEGIVFVNRSVYLDCAKEGETAVTVPLCGLI